MKEKRKNIISRVGAMVAAVLLVALCALPAFADGVEEQTRETLTESHTIIENAFDLLSIDPLYKLLRTGYSYTNKWLHQFRFAMVGTTLSTYEIITYSGYSGSPYSGAVYITTPNGDLFLEDGWFETSHTTRDGNKYIYFDWVDFSTSNRVFRFRMVIDVETGIYLRGAFQSDTYSNLNSEDISEYVVATALPKRSVPVIQYGIGRGLLEVERGVQVYYPNFVTIYDYGKEVGLEDGYTDGYNNGYADGYDAAEEYGYQLGYDEGYQIGKNVGYDDGMSQSSLIDGVTAIFRAPMELINSVLNFDIFGINMAVAVRVLISMAILGVVVTIIWKAVK